jgi:prefoldin subunit 5
MREGTDTTNLMSCRLLDPNWDAELSALRARAAQIPGEIQAIDQSIANIDKRTNKLRVDLSDVGTYIPPESTKTQFEGALNALRAERKVNIEASLEFYKDMRARREKEMADLQQELRDITAKIKAREDQIRKENEARQRAFPTALHQAKPDKCAYYHCHGTLCGKPDPEGDGCGQGATTEDDIDCSKFFNSYLKEAGVY